MREIVTMEQAEMVMRFLAIAGPVLGVAIGALLASRRRQILASGARAGFGWGLWATGAYGMWRVYNAITDRLGLDSVANLLVNLGLFLAVGTVAGRLIRQMGSGRNTASRAGAESLSQTTEEA